MLTVTVLKDLSGEFVGWTVLYFFVWWYSKGFKKTIFYSLQKIENGWKNLALSILLRNFFKPMYGSKGAAAYVLSWATHFLQLIWRLFLMVIWMVIWLIVPFVWIILPIFSLWQLILLIIF